MGRPLAAASPLPGLAARRPDLVGLALLLCTVLGWGLSWPVNKLLLGLWPPLSLRGMNGTLGGMALMLLALARGEALGVPLGQWGRLLLIAVLNVTCWIGFTTYSMLWLTAGEAAIAAYTMPLWTVLLAWPLLGERPTVRRVAGLATGLAGVAVLVGGGPSLDLSRLPGVVMSMLAAVTFALGTVVTKRAPLTLPPVAGAAWQVLLGALPLALAGLLLERADPAAMPAHGWALVAVVAAYPLGVCYLSWFAALRRLPAGLAATGTLLTPVIGVLGGTLLLGEPLGLRQGLALLLTVAGVLLALRG
ncbi:DMT family transporter [Roseomonas sp. NAR14]|uniref:DMT family transporter n=1 Tax=Roseomonas acroporae TaxID=2937791 RepID=A0A9X1Y7N2_9PROT|nr:DMT family transporter [Roseomonas acroporae]MCK8785469.1 DMT family transporter [Roseomonas acroporae]